MKSSHFFVYKKEIEASVKLNAEASCFKAIPEVLIIQFLQYSDKNLTEIISCR